MERRSFLQGLVLGIGAAATPTTALVQLASAEEVAAIATKNVLLTPEEARASWPPYPEPGAWLFMQDSNGFKPVGVVASMSMQSPMDGLMTMDMTLIVQGRYPRGQWHVKLKE